MANTSNENFSIHRLQGGMLECVFLVFGFVTEEL